MKLSQLELEELKEFLKNIKSSVTGKIMNNPVTITTSDDIKVILDRSEITDTHSKFMQVEELDLKDEINEFVLSVFEAVEQNDIALLAKYKEAEGDFNIILSNIESTHNLLTYAIIELADIEVIKFLIDSGCSLDFNLRKEGASIDYFTPLHLAILETYNPDLVKLLVEGGADKDAIVPDGKLKGCTPAFIATLLRNQQFEDSGRYFRTLEDVDGLQQILIPTDGNCCFNSVLSAAILSGNPLARKIATHEKLRQVTCDYLENKYNEYKEIYDSYNQQLNDMKASVENSSRDAGDTDEVIQNKIADVTLPKTPEVEKAFVFINSFVTDAIDELKDFYKKLKIAEGDFKHYISVMRRDGIWADSHEVRAMAEFLKINIHVHSARYKEPIKFESPEYSGLIHIRHTGSHYNLLVEKGTFDGISKFTGQYTILKALNDLGADFDFKMKEGKFEGETVHDRARMNQVVILKDIIPSPSIGSAADDPMDVDGGFADPVYQAVKDGEHLVLNALLSTGADPNNITLHDGPNTALFLACIKGDLKTVKLLIEKGANPNFEQVVGAFKGQTPFFAAVSNVSSIKSREIVEYLITQTHSAIEINKEQGDTEIEDAEEDKSGYTSLYESVIKNDADTVELLLLNGADVNQPVGVKHTKCTQEGSTPLAVAALNGYVDMANLLIKNGAKIYYKHGDGIKDLEGKNIFEFLTWLINEDSQRVDQRVSILESLSRAKNCDKFAIEISNAWLAKNKRNDILENEDALEEFINSKIKIFRPIFNSKLFDDGVNHENFFEMLIESPLQEENVSDIFKLLCSEEEEELLSRPIKRRRLSDNGSYSPADFESIGADLLYAFRRQRMEGLDFVLGISSPTGSRPASPTLSDMDLDCFQEFGGGSSPRGEF